MSECDTCGGGAKRSPTTGAVTGCVTVSVGNDTSYWFCSEMCHEKHWISQDVEGGQTRLHEVDS